MMMRHVLQAMVLCLTFSSLLYAENPAALSETPSAEEENPLELLAAEDRQATIDILVNATRSKQPTMRLQALSLLHQTDQAGDKTALLALEEALADHDVTVKSYAIQALAERGGPDAIEALCQVLRDPDVSLKKLLIESAARTEQGHALLQEALEDAEATIRALAAFWLEEAALKEK